MEARIQSASTVTPIRRKAMNQAATSGSEEWTNLLTKVGQQQDRHAFSRLFEHYAPQIKAYGLSTAATPGVQAFADELVQETMIKVWNRATVFDASKAGATTWIFAIARNARIDLIRRGARHRSDMDADDVWLEADVSEQPEQLTQADQSGSEIRQAIGQLPVEQAQVLGKVYLEGKSHTEVALELDLPLGTVKSRVRLALNKMKLLIRE